MKFLALGFLIVFCACASKPPKLTDAGETVNLVDALSASESRKYDKLYPIVCENSLSPSAGDNTTYCRTELRNKGAMMGADLVVVDGQEIGTPSCPQCVRLNGFAYRSKN